MAFLLLSGVSPSKTVRNQNPSSIFPPRALSSYETPSTFYPPGRREFLLETISICISCQTFHSTPVALCAPESSHPPKSILSGIANTKSWFQFYGDGFAIRVPPQFVDVSEPEDFNAGTSLYGDKAKPRTFAARFASADGYEVVSVIIKPSTQLKITFLEAQDISNIGSLKEAAKLFVPGGARLHAARTIKIKQDQGYRNYYFYEFSIYEQHTALVAAIDGGKTFVAGASAPESNWESDGVKLRSAAISLTLL